MDTNLAQPVDSEFMTLMIESKIYDIISHRHSSNFGPLTAIYVDGNRLDFIVGILQVLNKTLYAGALSS